MRVVKNKNNKIIIRIRIFFLISYSGAWLDLTSHKRERNRKNERQQVTDMKYLQGSISSFSIQTNFMLNANIYALLNNRYIFAINKFNLLLYIYIYLQITKKSEKYPQLLKLIK